MLGVLCLFITLPAVLSAATLRVPSEFQTIQSAIDASTAGDTVVVADGTYKGFGNKDLDFKGKSITVKSENGPYHCTVDCEGNGRGFHFKTLELSGDGYTGNEPDPTHTYHAAGVFTVRLKVVGFLGTDTETKTDHIVVKCPTKLMGDVDNDGKIGLEEAIHALQILSGIKQD